MGVSGVFPATALGIFCFLVIASATVGLVLAQDPSTTSKCSVYGNKDSCSQASCCFDESKGLCYSPVKEEDFDCPVLQTEGSCAIWSDTCVWRDGGCARIPRANSSQRCKAVREEREAEPDNTYCWGAITRTPCVFPFAFKGKVYDSCVPFTEASPPPKSANNIRKSQGIKKTQVAKATSWCGLHNGNVTLPNQWDYCVCTPKKRKKSVMFVIFDDLRTELKAYGSQLSKTPFIDELSTRPGSVVVDRAYTILGICSPSRAALLSGLSPDFSRVINSYRRGLNTFPQIRRKIKTLPQAFKEGGFYSTGGGKIYHTGHDDGPSFHHLYAPSLNQNYMGCTPDKEKLKWSEKTFIQTKFACQTKLPEYRMLDFQLAYKGARELEELVMLEREPFFMAVGIYKPHIPFHANEKYWKPFLNPPIPEPERLEGPTPKESYKVSLTFDSDSEMVSTLWRNDTGEQRRFRHTMRTGYLSVLYQADTAFGILLKKLDALKLRDSTMIVLVGDNGFALGENGLFGKDTNFDIATRVPVIFNVPWMAPKGSQPRMTRMRDFVQLHDLFQTMTALMNVRVKTPTPLHGVDHGKKIAYLAADRSDADKIEPARLYSFTQVYRCPKKFCTYTPLIQMSHVGYSIRTDEWRYVVFLQVRKGVVSWNNIVSEELYDHHDDDNTMLNTSNMHWTVEIENVASQRPEICQELFDLIVRRFKTNYSQPVFAK